MKEKKKVIIIVASVLAIAIIAGLVYFLVIRGKGAREFYESLLTDYSTAIEKQAGNNDKSSSGTMNLSFETTSNDETMKLLSDIKLAVDFGANNKDGEMVFNLDSTYQNKELLKGTFVLKENKAYFNIDGVTDKYLYTEMEGLNLNNNQSENATKMLNGIVDATKKALKDEYFSEEKVDGKKTYILALNNEQFQSFITDVVNSLKKNTEFINSVKNIYSLEDKDVTELLDELVSDAKKGTTDIKVTSYMKGNNADKIIIAMNVDEEKVDMELSNITDESLDFKVSGEDEITGNIIFKEEKDKNNFDMNIKVDEMTIKLSTTSEFGKQIEVPDLSKAKDANKMSENDMMKLYTKILENEGLVSLMTAINSLTSNLNM